MQQEYFGFKSIKSLKTVLKDNNIHSVFLVTGKGSFTASGGEGEVLTLLADRKVTRFMDFSPNPDLEDLKTGIKLFKSFPFDGIIAIGGGSVIDMAKAINLLAAQDFAPEEFITGNKKPEKMGKILIAIPTTAGSGSEGTKFSVINWNNKKYPLAHPYLLPDYALIDPDFSASQPPGLTAVSGIDALAQGIESLWSPYGTESSRLYARESIELILKHLVPAVKQPAPENREAMARGAFLAGKAINITGTTAPHAFSYYFTTQYNIPHGHAVALTLGSFIFLNGKAEKKDLTHKNFFKQHQANIKALLSSLQVSSPEEGKAKWYELMEALGLETNCGQLGFSIDEVVDNLLINVDKERLKNNPRKIKNSDILKILQN